MNSGYGLKMELVSLHVPNQNDTILNDVVPTIISIPS